MIDLGAEMNDLIRRLRDGIPEQSCETCVKDSVVFVRCGRGDCHAEYELRQQAADALEKMQEKANKDYEGLLAQNQWNAQRAEEAERKVAVLMNDLLRFA